MGVDTSALMIIAKAGPVKKSYIEHINRLKRQYRIVVNQPVLGEFASVLMRPDINQGTNNFRTHLEYLNNQYTLDSDKFPPVTNMAIRIAQRISDGRYLSNMDAIIVAQYITHPNIDMILTTDKDMLGLADSDILRDLINENELDSVPRIGDFSDIWKLRS